MRGGPRPRPPARPCTASSAGPSRPQRSAKRVRMQRMNGRNGSRFASPRTPLARPRPGTGRGYCCTARRYRGPSSAAPSRGQRRAKRVRMRRMNGRNGSRFAFPRTPLARPRPGTARGYCRTARRYRGPSSAGPSRGQRRAKRVRMQRMNGRNGSRFAFPRTPLARPRPGTARGYCRTARRYRGPSSAGPSRGQRRAKRVRMQRMNGRNGSRFASPRTPLARPRAGTARGYCRTARRYRGPSSAGPSRPQRRARAALCRLTLSGGELKTRYCPVTLGAPRCSMSAMYRNVRRNDGPAGIARETTCAHCV
jgi:hypothetical protein